MSEQPDRCFWGEGDDSKLHHMMGYSSSAESDAADIAPSEEVAPDCLGKLLGVRCFILRRPWSSSEHKRDDRLYSLFHEYMWTPGKEEHAVCLYHTAPEFKGLVAPREHASPDGRCGCGLYAYYDYWEAWRGAPLRDRFTIFAVVSGWVVYRSSVGGWKWQYAEQLLDLPDMVCEPCCHRWPPLLPALVARASGLLSILKLFSARARL